MEQARTMMSDTLRWGALVALALLVVGCTGYPLGPTPNLYLKHRQQPFEGLPAALRSTSADILYVTDRRPDNPEYPRGDDPQYGFHRSKSAAWGLARVSFGQDIDWQGLTAASTSNVTPAEGGQRPELSLERVTELGRFPPTPWPYTVVDGRVVDVPEVIAARDAEVSRVHKQLQDMLRESPRKDVLVFVHGFNNSFTDAALTLAQLWHFQGRVDVPVLYSWPAGRGGLGGYAYDRESGEFTAFHLKNFIKLLAADPQVERLHLVAHSRGTDVLTTALKDLTIEARAAGNDPRRQYRIANVVLAAPDLDVEVVSQRLASERVEQSVGRVTIYTSSNDKALGLTRWIFGSVARAGILRHDQHGENERRASQVYDNVDFVDYRGSSGGIDHGYFRDSPGVTSDMIKLLRDDVPPGAQYGRPLQDHGNHSWSLDDGYLLGDAPP